MKRGWMMLFGGTFLFIACIILGHSAVKTGIETGGTYGMNKVMVSPLEGADAGGTKAFTLSDFKKLADVLETEEITYAAQPEMPGREVTAGDAAFRARITGTDSMFENFHRISPVNGSFLTREMEERGRPVAVVDDEFAWTAFKSLDVIGQTVEIFGKPFKIIGVFPKDASAIGKLLEDGLPEVIIPGKLLLELDSTSKIYSIEVRSRYEDTMDRNVAWVSEGLQQIGRNSSEFHLADCIIKSALIGQRPYFVAFAAGSIAMLLLFSLMLRILKETFTEARKECGKEELFAEKAKAIFSVLLNRGAASLGKVVLKLLGAFSGMVFLWECIRFRLYIPRVLIPEELINISYYISLIKLNIRNSMNKEYYTAGISELYLEKIDFLTGGIYAVLALCSLSLLFLGLASLRRYGVDAYKSALICGLYAIGSVIVLSIVSYVMGLSLRMETGNILAVWILIFALVLHFAQKKERTNENSA